jgi:RNA 2',3'-cyclic 3'-phosphodiesterase
MRTFIAIPLPEACRSMLEQMQGELRRFGADVGWVAVPSIHITLKFLGEVDSALIPMMAAALETAAASTRSFDLQLQGLGCFPNQKNPRVIWCGIEGDREALSSLQQLVEKTCESFGFTPEDRGFQPHLTLGRVKGKRNLQPLMECIKIGSGLTHSFRADHFKIYKSTLMPKGAVHTVLNTVMLSD